MKKLSTLAVFILMATFAFAFDGRPTVTVRSNEQYKIVVDGRDFYGRNNEFVIPDIYTGQHEVRVYERRKGLFGSREVLVDNATFYLNYNDVLIDVNNRGNISIREMENRSRRHDNGKHKGWYKKDRDRRNNDDRYDDDDDRDDHYEKRRRG